MAIQSFADSVVERFYLEDRLSKGVGWAKVRTVAKRKLDMLNYASALGDLKSPPGNHLEPLEGNLAGLHSIRINLQWRVVFRWTDAGPTDVYVGDYH